MRKIVLAIAALALAGSAFASDCATDPDCAYVPEDSEALRTKDGVPAPGMYDPDSGRIYIKRTLSEECKRRIYDHERYHRQQHAQGRLVGREYDAELEAQQNAPVYNCGRRGPSGTLNNYAPQPRW